MAGGWRAHFNFVGDSLIGRDVDLEAGALIANHSFGSTNDRTNASRWPIAADGSPPAEA